MSDYIDVRQGDVYLRRIEDRLQAAFDSTKSARNEILDGIGTIKEEVSDSDSLPILFRALDGCNMTRQHLIDIADWLWWHAPPLKRLDIEVTARKSED